jgi:hypothetical protein
MLRVGKHHGTCVNSVATNVDELPVAIWMVVVLGEFSRGR